MDPEEFNEKRGKGTITLKDIREYAAWQQKTMGPRWDWDPDSKGGQSCSSACQGDVTSMLAYCPHCYLPALAAVDNEDLTVDQRTAALESVGKALQMTQENIEDMVGAMRVMMLQEEDWKKEKEGRKGDRRTRHRKQKKVGRSSRKVRRTRHNKRKGKRGKKTRRYRR